MITTPAPGRIGRAGWMAVGCGAVGVGTVGIVVPGLPTTVFFIAAAWCFSRSNPRFERWVLDLPRIGPMVRDHRAGLGMPLRAKQLATATVAVAITFSGVTLRQTPVLVGVVLALALVGVATIWFRVPTREQVIAARPPD
jgi:uncharacterized membrane protein YbaN (DUF454 family)